MRHSVMMLLVLFAACTQSSSAPPPPAAPVAEGPMTRIILPDGAPIRVEVVADDETRQQGLMFRDHLPEDRGMIFFFPESGEYPFWMKNTLIPLDMVWIDGSKHIAHIAHDVPPCKADPCPSYPPHAQAKYVLELAGGVAAKHHLKDGDALRFEGMEHVIVR